MRWELLFCHFQWKPRRLRGVRGLAQGYAEKNSHDSLCSQTTEHPHDSSVSQICFLKVNNIQYFCLVL